MQGGFERREEFVTRVDIESEFEGKGATMGCLLFVILGHMAHI